MINTDDADSQDVIARDRWIDGVCDQFERAWQSGRRPNIADFLRGKGVNRATLLRELLYLEIDYRRRAGEDPSREEYCRQFPEIDDAPLAFRFPMAEATKTHLPSRSVESAPREAAANKRSTERLKVVLVGEGGHSQTRDLTDQFRSRLRLFSALAAVSASVDLAIKLQLHGIQIFSSDNAWTHRQQSFLTLLFLALFESFAFFLLSERRSPTVRQLRYLEAFVFGGILLFFMENDIGAIRQDHEVIGKLWAAYTNSTALPYTMLIVSYGVLIPNPWRRCTAVIGLIAACVYLSTSVGFALAPQPIEVLTAYYGQLTIWLLIASVIVIYGAYRVEILRDQAERGKELGQYRLHQLLGSGGMGTVYLAEHRFLRRPCAIKVIHPESAGDPNNLKRFEREVHATATLTHPNTIQIYDYGHTEDGTFYYVMEHLEGLTLDELIKEHGRLAPPRAVHVLRQLSSALGEAHGIGLIHRDIKPGNVMVCRRGGIPDVVKLLDFGLVLPLSQVGHDERLSQYGAISGTPAYMSPEQINSPENLDSRSDIYSLGALAYFLLAGQSLFAGRTSVQMMAAHLYEQPESFKKYSPDVPADLENVVLRCLAKEPSARFSDVESLENALAACECAGKWSRQEADAWWNGHVGVKAKMERKTSVPSEERPSAH